ncbi:unnamed protein product [Cochlearia groenlandica]
MNNIYINFMRRGSRSGQISGSSHSDPDPEPQQQTPPPPPPPVQPPLRGPAEYHTTVTPRRTYHILRIFAPL